MNELEKAINFYCSMLPYPNTGANPNDDKRLYKISRIAYEQGLARIEKEMLLPYLKENSNTNLVEDQLIEFAENRTDEINHGIYILMMTNKD